MAQNNESGKKPKMVDVVGKKDAGVHPKYGRIIEGQPYRVPEHPFADQLFRRPASPDQVRQGGKKKK